MSYELIDPAISSWAESRGIILMREEQEPFRRHFYVSSQVGETVQIVVEPERGGMVRIDAHLIESPHEETAHFVWEASVMQTKNALDLAVGSAEAWFRRNVGEGGGAPEG